MNSSCIIDTIDGAQRSLSNQSAYQKYLLTPPKIINIDLDVSLALLSPFPFPSSSSNNNSPPASRPPSPPSPSSPSSSSSSPPSPSPSFYCTVLQYSIHKIPTLMKRELSSVISSADIDIKNTQQEILCVPTWQKSKIAMIHVTKESRDEKNRLLECFYVWGKSLCYWLRSHTLPSSSNSSSFSPDTLSSWSSSTHYWSDLIDPCTGYPTIGSSCGGIYSEVDGIGTLLRYKIQQAGSCSVLLHPLWGEHGYPASIFTNAPYELVEKGIEYINSYYHAKPYTNTIDIINDSIKALEQEQQAEKLSSNNNNNNNTKDGGIGGIGLHSHGDGDLCDGCKILSSIKHLSIHNRSYTKPALAQNYTSH